MNFFLMDNKDYSELMTSREEVSQLISQNIKREEKNPVLTFRIESCIKHFIKEENVSSESQLRLCALSLEVMFGDRLFFLICSFADSDKNEGDKK